MASYADSFLGSDLGLAIDLRKLRVANDEDAVSELEEFKTKSASADPEELLDFLTEFDKKNELIHMYGKYILDPVQSVYGSSIDKMASGTMVSIGEQAISEDVFSEWVGENYGSIEDSFGQDLATQLKSDPVGVFNSLPVTYKQAIGQKYQNE